MPGAPQRAEPWHYEVRGQASLLPAKGRRPFLHDLPDLGPGRSAGCLPTQARAGRGRLATRATARSPLLQLGVAQRLPDPVPAAAWFRQGSGQRRVRSSRARMSRCRSVSGGRLATVRLAHSRSSSVSS